VVKWNEVVQKSFLGCSHKPFLDYHGIECGNMMASLVEKGIVIDQLSVEYSLIQVIVTIAIFFPPMPTKR